MTFFRDYLRTISKVLVHTSYVVGSCMFGEGKKLVRECNKSPQAAAKRKEESSEIISLTVPSTYIILIHEPKFFFLEQNLWTTSTLYYGMRLCLLLPPELSLRGRLASAAAVNAAAAAAPPAGAACRRGRCSLSGSRQPRKIVNWIFRRLLKLLGSHAGDNNFRRLFRRVIYEIKFVPEANFDGTHTVAG